MRKKLRFFVSTENKILLHLKRFLKIDSTKKVPQDIIQMGIANNLGSPRGSISRALGNLINKGFVEEKLCRVAESKRRMNAYFLSWEGRSQADSLEDRLATELVEVRAEDGALIDATISEALDLSDNALTISELLRLIEIHGYYDPKTHSENKDLDAVEPSGTVDSSISDSFKPEVVPTSAPSAAEGTNHTAAVKAPVVPAEQIQKEIQQFTKVPPVRIFYGRSDEQESISDILRNYPVFFIKGMAGIGKTTLMAKVIRQFDPTWKVFWYRLQEWDTSKGFLQGLADFFSSIGYSRLSDELEAGRQDVDIYKLIRVLVHEFRTIKGLVVIDDFHRASKSIQQLFSGLLENTDSKSLIHLIFISRAHIPIFDQRDTVLKKNVKVLELSGLDITSSREMLGGRKVSEKDFNRIYSITKGHPLALELIKNSGVVTDLKDMMNFVNEQVYKNLKKDERAVLSFLSVYRKPVPISAFLDEDEADFDTVDNLINNTLIVEIEPTLYDVHDLIREFFYSRLVKKLRQAYHKNAAEFYSESEETELDILEAVFHYINAGDQDRAAEIMINRAPKLIECGYLDEAMGILMKFETNINPEYLAKLYNLKGDILSTWGEWDNVFEYYWQCYFLEFLMNRDFSKPEFLKTVGYIGWKPSEVEVALKNLNSSLDVLKGSSDLEGVTDVENSLAWLKWMTGEYPESKVIYKNLEKDLSAKNERIGAAKILLKLGNVYWSDDDLDASIETYQKSREIFESESDYKGAAQLNSLIGIIYLQKGDYLQALKHFEKTKKLSGQRKFKKGYTYGQLHIIQNLMVQDRFDDAQAELETARKSFETLQDDLGLAYTSVMEGIIYKLTKQNKKAIGHFENAINHLHGFLMPYYKSKIFSELNSLYKLTGESEKAHEAKQLAQEKMDQKEE